jgi:hypothetical protein
MKTLALLLCCVVGFTMAIGLGRKQSSGAKGILTCKFSVILMAEYQIMNL